MGEQTTVAMTAKTINDLGRVLGRELAKALAEQAAPAPVSGTDATDVPAPPVDIVPWEIYDPRRACVVAAYVDAEQQQRWVPLGDEGSQPKTWRKLYRAAL